MSHATHENRNRQTAARKLGCRYCPGCRKVKPLGLFHRNRRQKDGRAVYCKVCNSLQAGLRRRRAGYVPTKRKRKQAPRPFDQKKFESNRRYQKTPVGRLVYQRSHARWRMKLAKPKWVPYWHSKIELLNQAIVKAMAKRALEGTGGLDDMSKLA